MNNVDDINNDNSREANKSVGDGQMLEAPCWPFATVWDDQEVNKVQAPAWRGDIKHRFGARLKQLRTERGYTQMKLAMEAGCDRSYLCDVERGLKEMALTKLFNL